MEIVLFSSSLSYSLILVPIPIVIIIIIITTTLYFTFFSTSSKTKSHQSSSSTDHSKYPLGKTGWPFIGESLEFLRLGRNGAPDKFISIRMHHFSKDVFKTSLFGEPCAVFCGPGGNKFLFSNENKLVNTWWPKSVDKIFPPGKNMSSQADAKRLRKLLPKFLKAETLRRYIPIMDIVARKHFETNWDNKREVQVFPLVKNYTFALACQLFASIEDPHHVEELGKHVAAVENGIIAIPIDLPGTLFNRGIKAANYVRGQFLEIVKQRKIDLAENKASPNQDMLSHMLSITDEDGQFMTEFDISNKILGLVVGGVVGNAAITFIVKYLVELPEIYNEVQNEQTEIAKSKGPGELLNWDDIQKMKYSWNVACEVLRLSPPVQGGFKEAIADFAYLQYSIPKGWKCYWSPNTTHKNPDYFKDPEKFDPSRFEGNGPAPYTFIPFGGGPRMCPGKEYAKLEILAFMYHIVRRYKFEKVVPNEKIVLNPLPEPAKGLPVRLYPQASSC